MNLIGLVRNQNLSDLVFFYWIEIRRCISRERIRIYETTQIRRLHWPRLRSNGTFDGIRNRSLNKPTTDSKPVFYSHHFLQIQWTWSLSYWLPLAWQLSRSHTATWWRLGRLFVSVSRRVCFVHFIFFIGTKKILKCHLNSVLSILCTCLYLEHGITTQSQWEWTRSIT